MSTQRFCDSFFLCNRFCLSGRDFKISIRDDIQPAIFGGWLTLQLYCSVHGAVDCVCPSSQNDSSFIRIREEVFDKTGLSKTVNRYRHLLERGGIAEADITSHMELYCIGFFFDER